MPTARSARRSRNRHRSIAGFSPTRFAPRRTTTPRSWCAAATTRARTSRKIPGSLKFFSFKDGQLANRVTVAPDGGFGFGPRHLEFHPKLPFVYVSRERENKLNVYRLVDGVIDPQALFVKETLAAPDKIVSRQSACTLHAHPNGRFLYLANRAFDSVKVDGKDVFPGGENNIAVFAIDQTTGEPTAIQNEDVRGVYPRTFALDPSARMLAVTDVEPRLARDHIGVTPFPPISRPSRSAPTASSPSPTITRSTPAATCSSGAAW